MTRSRPEVLVLGAGSSGSRHARNLVAAGASVAIADHDVGRASALTEIGARVITLDEISSGHFDGAVVASPTSLHVEHGELSLSVAERVLVEKPLGIERATLDPLLRDGVAERVAVAYNLRFHPPLARLVSLVHDGTVGPVRSVSLWFGSWLPDWRPASDYRQSYSARADLGGGVLLDAIHELDALLWLLGDGDYRVLGALVDRLGSLEIDVEDTVIALMLGPGGESVTVHLDYLSRRYRRGVEVIGDRATARLDWARQVLEVEDAEGSRPEPADTPVSVSYESQAFAFLDWIGGGASMPVSATLGARSLALADAIRAAAT